MYEMWVSRVFVVIICHNKQTDELKWFFQVIFINNSASRKKNFIKCAQNLNEFTCFLTNEIEKNTLSYGLDVQFYVGISQCSTLNGLLQQHDNIRSKKTVQVIVSNAKKMCKIVRYLFGTHFVWFIICLRCKNLIRIRMRNA